MIFTPIFDRELRIRSRQSATYWSRCLAGAVASLLAIQTAVGYATSSTPSALGITIFNSLSWLGFLFASAFVVATADCISSERRNGTLGLLFLSGVQPGEIVRGKLAGAATSAFYGLMGTLPALALGMLLGGITGFHLLRTSLALLNMLFVSAAIGIWASCREEKQLHSLRTAAVTIALLVFAPLISWRLPSPYWPFHLADDVAYAGAIKQFWVSLGLSHLLGWGFILAATRTLQANWRECESDSPRPVSVFSKGKRKEIKPPEPNKWLLEKDPMCWLSRRFHEHNRLIWIGVLLMFASGPGGLLFIYWSRLSAYNLFTVVNLVGNLGVGCVFAWLAGKYCLEARSSGELELLLSTPLGGRDIVGGRWRALLLQFRGPLLAAFFVEFLGFLFLAGPGRGSPKTNLPLWLAALGPFNRMIEVVAFAWVGMWFGLKAGRPWQMSLWSVVLVAAIPVLVWYSVLAVLRLAFGNAFFGLFVFYGYVWPLLTLAKNIVFIYWAARKLKREFRTVAPLNIAGWFETDERLVELGTFEAKREPAPSLARDIAVTG